MTDGVNINSSALKAPDYLGSYVNAFKVGQALAAAPAGVNALTGSPTRPAASTPIETVTAPPRDWGAEQAEVLGGVALGLKSIPYADRPAVLAHLTPALAARGLPPQAIAEFDPSDEDLDATMAEIKAVRETPRA